MKRYEELDKGAREMAKLLKMPVSGQDLHPLIQASLEIWERHLDSL